MFKFSGPLLAGSFVLPNRPMPPLTNYAAITTFLQLLAVDVKDFMLEYWVAPKGY